MPGQTILIVDDNPHNLKVARVLLESEGYDVRAVGDAEAVLHLLDSFTPDLILMDIQLPGMDGLELTRLLKSHPTRRAIKILALTAYAMLGDRERILAAGCDGYVAKPIDIETLLRSIADLLGPSEHDAAEAMP